MMKTVFVDGQEGTTGLQIRERLSAHPGVQCLEIASDERKNAVRRSALINQADLVFLCLPDAAAREAVALIAPDNTHTRVIDASTAHRIAPGWTYGLPELSPAQREAIRVAPRVAVNGCHASGLIVLLAPLVAAGLVPADYPVVCHSLTGYSGGGKAMIAQYEAERERHGLDAARWYALGQMHKHLPEMRHYSGLRYEPVFLPLVDDFYQGLAVSIPLHTRLLPVGVTRTRVYEALADHYRDARWVRVMPLDDPGNAPDGFFDVQACNQSNRCDVFVFGNDERMVLIARLDNLGKGASGAAVQCMNLMLGFDEGLGLGA